MAKLKAKPPRYTVILQWDEDDQIYIASLPEWGPSCKTHGDTYEEAAKNAREVLELLIETTNGKAVELPLEKHFRYPGADVIDVSDDESDRPRGKISRKKSRQSA